jgi:hypothetical protein
MLTVMRGPTPRVLGSALVGQVVRRTADGWRIASRVIHDTSLSEPAAAHGCPPSAAEPQSARRETSLLAGSSARRRPDGGGPLAVPLQAPSVGAVVRGVLILTACALVLYLVWRIRIVVRLIAISLFLALALIPVIDALATKTPAPRALIILMVYVALIASVAVIGYVVVPSLVKEVGQLSHHAP